MADAECECEKYSLNFSITAATVISALAFGSASGNSNEL